MKALNYILAVLLISIFFVACTTESFEEQNAENAALIHYDNISKSAMTLDDTQQALTEGEKEVPASQWRDPSEDEDDMPDPNGKDPSEDEDDMPDPNGKDPSEDEDDMPDPNGKDPSEDEDDMPDPNTMP